MARVQDGGGPWVGAAGAAEMDTDRKPRAGERFRAGSVGKSFVATVVLQLEAEGRLDSDDTVEKWLPGLVRGNGNDGSKITVRQLLNHTSGIYSYTADPAVHLGGMAFLKHRYDTWKPEQLVRIAMAHRPYFPPGSDWTYSNTNYTLAAMVVERVTGRPYESEARQRIIKPLGLRSTFLPGADSKVPGPAGRGYTGFADDPELKAHDVTEFNPSVYWANGDLISTTGDLDRFYSALLRGVLLPPAQMKEMTTTRPIGTSGYVGAGLGLVTYRTSCGTELWGHNGSVPGTEVAALSTRDGSHRIVTHFSTDVFLTTPATADIIDAEFC
ncbi:serine hydrolase domain-containing protein [Streptomyces stramineus]